MKEGGGLVPLAAVVWPLEALEDGVARPEVERIRRR